MADSTVDSVAGAPRSYEAYVEESRKPKSQLGKSDFLSLLAAQLQYQDPMEPMTDSAFVAQLAQFSSLEQLENLNTTMSVYQYYSLAGKYVYCSGYDDNGTEFAVAGIVDRVINSNGECYVQIGETLVKAKFVTEVYDRELMTGNNNPLIETSKLLGNKVYGYVYKESPEGGLVPTAVYGIVNIITIENGEIVAYLDNGEKLPVANILDIRDPSAPDYLAADETDPAEADETEVADPESAGDTDDPGETDSTTENP